MDTRNLDERLEQLFAEGTELEPEVKKEIWNNIEHELLETAKGGHNWNEKKKELVRLAASVAAVAVIVIG